MTRRPGRDRTDEGGPVQLDLLDWLAAQGLGTIEFPAPPCPGAGADDAAPVLLTRVEPALNMHRFYGLALVRSLWGEWGVARLWGRTGRPGRVRTDWHESSEAAAAGLATMARAKQRRGYR